MKKITVLLFTVSLVLTLFCACAENKELSEEDKNLYTSNTEIVKVDSINDLEFDKIVKLTDNVSGHIYTTEDSQKIEKLINIIKKAKINNLSDEGADDFYKLYMGIYHETIDKETMPSTVQAVNSGQDNNANDGDKNQSISLSLPNYILKDSTEITKPTITLREGNEFSI